MHEFGSYACETSLCWLVSYGSLALDAGRLLGEVLRVGLLMVLVAVQH